MTSYLNCAFSSLFCNVTHTTKNSSLLSEPPGCPGGSDGKESACNAGDLGSITGLGRSSGGVNGYPLHYPGLENSMDRGAWSVTVHGVTKSQTRLSDFHIHTCSAIPICYLTYLNRYTLYISDLNLKWLLLKDLVKDREAWHAAVHRVTKSWTWLSNWTTTNDLVLESSYPCIRIYIPICVCIYVYICIISNILWILKLSIPHWPPFSLHIIYSCSSQVSSCFMVIRILLDHTFLQSLSGCYWKNVEWISYPSFFLHFTYNSWQGSTQPYFL